MRATIVVGDCRETLRRLDDASVDSVVCDPPYHLTSIVKRFGAVNAAPAKVGKTGAYARASKGFMGQTWDGGDVAFQPETWAEILRVLKPGGHLVAFSGSRTYHRMAVAIEDAGFEVRDMLSWLYGSGFPKSHDVSKGIDKAAGVAGQFGAPKTAAHAGWIDRGRMRGDEGHEGYPRPWMADEAAVDRNARQYLPGTDAAREWQGWGTALKPAHEPICLARKPLIGTVAANVLAHGTGAINIDGCRIEGGEGGARDGEASAERRYTERGATNFAATPGPRGGNAKGRWPANICHDGSDEVRAGFPDTVSGAMKREVEGYPGDGVTGFIRGKSGPSNQHGDSGSASRFFYCAKTSGAERGEGNNHPTVKPIALMAWLCRLVTPKGGLVLDPFTGSGSTAIAALAEGFQFFGCELSPEYAAIAKRRIEESGGMFAQVTLA